MPLPASTSLHRSLIPFAGSLRSKLRCRPCDRPACSPLIAPRAEVFPVRYQTVGLMVSERRVTSRHFASHFRKAPGENRQSNLTGQSARHCKSMSMVQPALLTTLANCCLREWPSRALDARIYCAVLGFRDANLLNTPSLIQARSRGMVLLRTAGRAGWIDAPRYTADLGWAKSLLPEGLATISQDPQIVCATALMAIARMERPLLLEA